MRQKQRCCIDPHSFRQITPPLLRVCSSCYRKPGFPSIFAIGKTMFRPHHYPARMQASAPDRPIPLAVLCTPRMWLVYWLADALASIALMRLSLCLRRHGGPNRPEPPPCKGLALKVLDMKLVTAAAGSHALASARLNDRRLIQCAGVLHRVLSKRQRIYSSARWSS